MKLAGKAGAFQSPGPQPQTPQQINVVHCRANLANQFLKKRNSSVISTVSAGSRKKIRPHHSLPKINETIMRWSNSCCCASASQKCRRRAGKFLPGMVEAQQRVASVSG